MSTAAHWRVVQWRSRTTFILALSASAVGLGNLWRFSYLSGEHGGGPFIVAYIACLFLIAVPLMIAEVVLGHQGRAGPVVSIRLAADRSGRSRGWMLVGALACVTGMLILAFYAVVGGWALAYAHSMYLGAFSALPAVEVGEHFLQLLERTRGQIYWQSLFLAAATGVLIIGVRRGLGLLVWLAVPALLALLGYLIGYGFEHGDMRAAGDFLFSTRLVDFSPHSALVALGHAFYTLGVGVGTGICYGAYAPDRIPVGRSVVAVAVFDTMIALAAGLAIFPIVFANNMEAAMGPGLMFVSLPYAFGSLAQGDLYGTLFFLLVVVAALGSAVAILEPCVSALMQHLRMHRVTAALLAGTVVWLLGVAVVFSLHPDAVPSWYGNRNLFELLDAVSTDFLLPLVGLLTAILVGWRLRPDLLREHLQRESPAFFAFWRMLLRYVVPPAIGLLLLAPLW
ncbi:MAG: sodium-dependent transporter [Halioglobus sp.]|nr:sodium-dependent transporter [Halioglobus sp.]